MKGVIEDEKMTTMKVARSRRNRVKIRCIETDQHMQEWLAKTIDKQLDKEVREDAD